MKRGTSPSGKKDRPPCFAHAKGKCPKGDACDYWHPPVCKYFKAGNCSEGKKCCFLHPGKDVTGTPAKKQETASSGKDGDQDAEGKKAKAKAKPKEQAKVFLRISPPTSTCFTTVKSKKVHFSKFSEKKSVKDNKLPTYIKWDARCSNFEPKRTNPDGTINHPEQEEIEFYENWSRKQALKLWNELHPKNKLKAEEFFVGGDPNLPEPEESQEEGNLPQDVEPESNEPWTFVVKKKSTPKKIQKAKIEPTAQKKVDEVKTDVLPTERLRSALKGKQKIFYLQSTSGRNYIVDSGASFHLVSRDELTDQESSTIVSLGEAIPIQTANGEVELKEKCQIYVRDLKVKIWAHILPETVAVLSLGLLVEELRFSYVWNPGKCPILRKGNLTVKCHPTNNVPFICPGASVEPSGVSQDAGGSSSQDGKPASTDEDELEGLPALVPSDTEADEEDVPKVRSRP